MSQQNFFRQIQKKFSITYYYSTLFFPLKVREKVWVLYSFLRIIDEIVDNPISDSKIALESFEGNFWEKWHKTEKFFKKENLKNKEINNLFKFYSIQHKNTVQSLNIEKEIIIIAFINLAFEYKFEKKWIEGFFSSMAMDLTIQSYKTYDDLLKYIYGSAEVVGLMMNKIMGGTNLGENYAKKLGRAMQLTNFLRDIKEDFQRGRIYIPLEDFERFKLSVSDFKTGNSVPFLNLIKFEIQKIVDIYEDVFLNAHYIPSKSRLAVLTATYVYFDVLQRIAKSPHKLWTHNFKKTFFSFPKAIFKSIRLLKKYRKKAISQ